MKEGTINKKGLKDVRFYICNPKKNEMCEKSNCAYSVMTVNPECRFTLYPEFSDRPEEEYAINPKTMELELYPFQNIH